MFDCHRLLPENVRCTLVVISKAGVLPRLTELANAFTELGSSDVVS